MGKGVTGRHPQCPSGENQKTEDEEKEKRMMEMCLWIHGYLGYSQSTLEDNYILFQTQVYFSLPSCGYWASIASVFKFSESHRAIISCGSCQVEVNSLPFKVINFALWLITSREEDHFEAVEGRSATAAGDIKYNFIQRVWVCILIFGSR